MASTYSSNTLTIKNSSNTASATYPLALNSSTPTNILNAVAFGDPASNYNPSPLNRTLTVTVTTCSIATATAGAACDNGASPTLATSTASTVTVKVTGRPT